MAKAKTKRAAPRTGLKKGVHISASLERQNPDKFRQKHGYDYDYVLRKLYVEDGKVLADAGCAEVLVCDVSEVGEFVEFLSQIAEEAKSKS